MKLGTILGLGAVAASLLLVMAVSDRSDAKTQPADTFPLATPLGVTMQPLGRAQGYGPGANYQRDQIAYTDLRGLTLYTREEDPLGRSTCAGECAEMFKPFLAAADANPFGDWSVIIRDDGQKQWALKGKALYTYVKDVDPGSVGGQSPANVGNLRRNGAGQLVGGCYLALPTCDRSEVEPMPAGWAPALAYPVEDIALPAGMSVQEVEDAAAIVLVNREGRTLYAVTRENAREFANCSTEACREWIPVRAPQAAEAFGEFSIVEQHSGIPQWAFMGRDLYTYRGDLAPGYANGIGVDPRMSVAAVKRYYMPESVSLQDTLAKGRTLATNEGMTLYRREGYMLKGAGGHALRRGEPLRPAVGRDIGTDARCDSECRKMWHPFLADTDAQPSGFWDIATRPDGSRQWVYQGYALWTYDGDHEPGDMNGHDIFDIEVPDDPSHMVDLGTPMSEAAALWWAIAVP